MGNRLLACAAVLLVVLVATLALWGEGNSEPVLRTAPSSRPVESAPARSATTPAAPSPQPTRSDDAPTTPTWIDELSSRGDSLLADEYDPHAITLRGQLTVRQQPTQHPAGIEIRLTRSFLDTIIPTDAGEQDELAPTVDDPTATTDADGRFALRFRPTQGELFFLIDRGGAWMDFQRVADVPRPGGTLDLGAVYVDARGGIRGDIVDRFGKPVREATVRAVDAPLSGSRSELAELRSLRNANAENFFTQGALRSGPIPDWVVRRDRFLPFPQVDARKGKFLLRGLRPGTHDLYVQAANGSAHLIGVQVASGQVTEVGEIRLGIANTMRLRFGDERRRPWIGAGISLIHVDSGFGSPIVHTDANGEVTVTAADDGIVVFGYPGGGPWIQLESIALHSDGRRSRTRRPKPGMRHPKAMFRVPRARPIKIHLTDRQGQRIENGRARLFVAGEAFRPLDRALPGAMQPRSDGAGTLIGSAPCNVIVVASAAGYAPAISPFTQWRSAEMTLQMLPRHNVTVRVRDRDDRPVAGAAIRLHVHACEDHDFTGAQWEALANDRVRVGRTADDGTLTVPVWDTLFSFHAEHPDFAPSPGPKLRPRPNEVIDIRLRAPAMLSGQLLIHRRPAPRGLRLRARLRPPGTHELASSGWLDEDLAVTGEQGKFAFRGLCAGIWHITPELPSQPSPTGPTVPDRQWKTVRVSLEEGQSTFLPFEAELEALTTPQLTGTISLNGLLAADALVRVRRSGGLGDPGGRTEARLQTDAFGDFAFSGLRPDTDYEVRIDVLDQGRLQRLHQSTMRTPARDTEGPCRLDLVVPCGALQLWCEHNGRPAANRMLRLRQVVEAPATGGHWELLTDLRGGCFVANLPAGTWAIEAVHGGHCEPPEFTIPPGSPSTVTVALRPE